ncbi:hypothetical protein, partial [Mesorhizobium sp. M2D.F.Ca.ET.153.01.1.1]|uniref:hypothetical protein n=1 Tax=Mesorhizobium sp. M2D.F.Ca.ET.153.01.1.1 TaxID=2500520 RepID=UPI001AEDFAC9
HPHRLRLTAPIPKEKRPDANAARPEMKVKPSEGNTVRRNGRRTPNDESYVGFDRQVCDEQNSKYQPNREIISRKQDRGLSQPLPPPADRHSAG